MSDSIYGMTHCCLKDEHIILLGDVYLNLKGQKFWINVMQHNMDDILQETKQPRKFSGQVSIGQLYSETILSG